MRHRIGAGNCIGLGNPEKVKLDNKGMIPKPLAEAYVNTWPNEYEGCDFQVNEDKKGVVAYTLGIEPAYQGQKLHLVILHRKKNLSSVTEGRAFGYYGSNIVAHSRMYGDYKYKSKFVRFIDEWHEKIFGGKR